MESVVEVALRDHRSDYARALCEEVEGKSPGVPGFTLCWGYVESMLAATEDQKVSAAKSVLAAARAVDALR